MKGNLEFAEVGQRAGGVVERCGAEWGVSIMKNNQLNVQ